MSIYSRRTVQGLTRAAPGCRRIIVDAGYLGSLERSNVTLVPDDIESVSGAGVKPRSADAASIPVDHIVLATGYDMASRSCCVPCCDGILTGCSSHREIGPSPGAMGFLCDNIMIPKAAQRHTSVSCGTFSQDARSTDMAECINRVILSWIPQLCLPRWAQYGDRSREHPFHSRGPDPICPEAG